MRAMNSTQDYSCPGLGARTTVVPDLIRLVLIIAVLD